MTQGSDEIRVHGRIYRHSNHFRNSIHRHPEATNENIEYVLMNPFYQETQGPRRTVYWRYIPELEKHMKVVEDRLPTGELQILTAYCPSQTPLHEGSDE